MVRCRDLLRADLGALIVAWSARRPHPTRWGMYTVAVGGNRHGAAEAGIKVRSIVIRNFVLCAFLAGFVGVLEAVRASTVTPDTAGAAETMFRAVSAAVIGGSLLTGGEGTVVGALLGALFLGILRDGLVLEGVNADYLDFILGLAILVAMCINTYVGRVRKGQWLWLSPATTGETSSGSSTCPSDSGRSQHCATSTSISSRERCSGCSATTARASRP